MDADGELDEDGIAKVRSVGEEESAGKLNDQKLGRKGNTRSPVSKRISIHIQKCCQLRTRQ